jgi:dipicolinate synthase subunit A
VKSFLIVGGDLRYIKLAEFLSLDDDNKVYAMGFDKNIFTAVNVPLQNSVVLNERRVDYLILPIPAAKDDIHVNTKYFSGDIPLRDLVPMVKEDGVVFAGRLTASQKAIFEDAGLTVIDYSDREEFAVMNAVATAEGAVQIAMEETESTLSSQKILILGMGRIAKVLIRQLSGFTSDITAAARKPHDIAWAGIMCKGTTLTGCYHHLDEYDLIYNTIPSMILTEKRIEKLRKTAVIVDLASKPGGTDFNAAAKLGIKAIHALSIPGRVAPFTAGCVIAQTIENIIAERGV